MTMLVWFVGLVLVWIVIRLICYYLGWRFLRQMARDPESLSVRFSQGYTPGSPSEDWQEGSFTDALRNPEKPNK